MAVLWERHEAMRLTEARQPFAQQKGLGKRNKRVPAAVQHQSAEAPTAHFGQQIMEARLLLAGGLSN